jgi:hypothetical protein
MAHTDTLGMYKNYIAGGYSDEQATAAVQCLESSFNRVATKDDLNDLERDFNISLHNGLNNLEKDLKIFLAYVLGGTLMVAFIVPLLIQAIVRFW